MEERGRVSDRPAVIDNQPRIVRPLDRSKSSISVRHEDLRIEEWNLDSSRLHRRSSLLQDVTHQPTSLGSTADQPPPGRRIELTDMAERECTQERSQSRGGVGADEQLLHSAVAQQPHVVDRIGAGDHPGHQRGDFQPGVGTEVARQMQVRIGQLPKARSHRHCHRRVQARSRHEIRIIKRRRQDRILVGKLHLRDVLLVGQIRTDVSPIFPVQRDILCLTSRHSQSRTGGSRLKPASPHGPGLRGLKRGDDHYARDLSGYGRNDDDVPIHVGRCGGFQYGDTDRGAIRSPMLTGFPRLTGGFAATPPRRKSSTASVDYKFQLRLLASFFTPEPLTEANH